MFIQAGIRKLSGLPFRAVAVMMSDMPRQAARREQGEIKILYGFRNDIS